LPQVLRSVGSVDSAAVDVASLRFLLAANVMQKLSR
jgi:hypothetical protein